MNSNQSQFLIRQLPLLLEVETNPVVNIASAKKFLDFCRDNNISVRGHVLMA